MSLYRIGDIAKAAIGETEFFRAIKSEFDYARTQERQHLTFDEWDGLFEKAREAGIVALRSEADPRFASPLGFALFRLWKAMQSAKERGLTPREFHEEYCDLVKAAIDERRRKTREEEKAAAKRRAAAQRERQRKKDEIINYDEEVAI